MSKVYWITGLSGAGKTTLGSFLTKSLRDIGKNVIFLDGDVLRECLDIAYNNSRSDRLNLALKYSKLSRMLASQGATVVIATISLFKEVHKWNRENIEDYIEIFLDVPISELINRDPKGLYKKALSGEIKNVAGLDMNVDYPSKPNFHMKFEDQQTVEELTHLILSTDHQIKF